MRKDEYVFACIELLATILERHLSDPMHRAPEDVDTLNELLKKLRSAGYSYFD